MYNRALMKEELRPDLRREELLRSIQFHLLVTRRELLTPSEWAFSLCNPFWRIYVNEDSGASVIHEGGSLHLRPGLLYILPGWVAFQTETTRPVMQNYIHFDVTGFPPSLLRQAFPGPVVIPTSSLGSDVQETWLAGQKEKSLPGLCQFIVAGALVHVVMAVLLSGLSGEEEQACFRWIDESGEIGPALRGIETCLQPPPTNDQLAALCHLSKSHFIRRFHRAVGMAPAEYGRDRRIAIAARMLHDEKLTIDQVAEQTGFSDRFHFSRAFKARLGISPAKYRQSCFF